MSQQPDDLDALLYQVAAKAPATSTPRSKLQQRSDDSPPLSPGTRASILGKWAAPAEVALHDQARETYQAAHQAVQPLRVESVIEDTQVRPFGNSIQSTRTTNLEFSQPKEGTKSVVQPPSKFQRTVAAKAGSGTLTGGLKAESLRQAAAKRQAAVGAKSSASARPPLAQSPVPKGASPAGPPEGQQRRGSADPLELQGLLFDANEILTQAGIADVNSQGSLLTQAKSALKKVGVRGTGGATNPGLAPFSLKRPVNPKSGLNNRIPQISHMDISQSHQHSKQLANLSQQLIQVVQRAQQTTREKVREASKLKSELTQRQVRDREQANKIVELKSILDNISISVGARDLDFHNLEEFIRHHGQSPIEINAGDLKAKGVGSLKDEKESDAEGKQHTGGIHLRLGAEAHGSGPSYSFNHSMKLQEVSLQEDLGQGGLKLGQGPVGRNLKNLQETGLLGYGVGGPPLQDQHNLSPTTMRLQQVNKLHRDGESIASKARRVREERAKRAKEHLVESHAKVRSNPALGEGPVPRHIQRLREKLGHTHPCTRVLRMTDVLGGCLPPKPNNRLIPCAAQRYVTRRVAGGSRAARNSTGLTEHESRNNNALIIGHDTDNPMLVSQEHSTRRHSLHNFQNPTISKAWKIKQPYLYRAHSPGKGEIPHSPQTAQQRRELEAVQFVQGSFPSPRSTLDHIHAPSGSRKQSAVYEPNGTHKPYYSRRGADRLLGGDKGSPYDKYDYVLGREVPRSPGVSSPPRRVFLDRNLLINGEQEIAGDVFGELGLDAEMNGFGRDFSILGGSQGVGPGMSIPINPALDKIQQDKMLIGPKVYVKRRDLSPSEMEMRNQLEHNPHPKNRYTGMVFDEAVEDQWAQAQQRAMDMEDRASYGVYQRQEDGRRARPSQRAHASLAAQAQKEFAPPQRASRSRAKKQINTVGNSYDEGDDDQEQDEDEGPTIASRSRSRSPTTRNSKSPVNSSSPIPGGRASKAAAAEDFPPAKGSEFPPMRGTKPGDFPPPKQSKASDFPPPQKKSQPGPGDFPPQKSSKGPGGMAGMTSPEIGSPRVSGSKTSPTTPRVPSQLQNKAAMKTSIRSEGPESLSPSPAPKASRIMRQAAAPVPNARQSPISRASLSGPSSPQGPGSPQLAFGFRPASVRLQASPDKSRLRSPPRIRASAAMASKGQGQDGSVQIREANAVSAYNLLLNSNVDFDMPSGPSEDSPSGAIRTSDLGAEPMLLDQQGRPIGPISSFGVDMNSGRILYDGGMVLASFNDCGMRGEDIQLVNLAEGITDSTLSKLRKECHRAITRREDADKGVTRESRGRRSGSSSSESESDVGFGRGNRNTYFYSEEPLKGVYNPHNNPDFAPPRKEIAENRRLFTTHGELNYPANLRRIHKTNPLAVVNAVDIRGGHLSLEEAAEAGRNPYEIKDAWHDGRHPNLQKHHHSHSDKFQQVSPRLSKNKKVSLNSPGEEEPLVTPKDHLKSVIAHIPISKHDRKSLGPHEREIRKEAAREKKTQKKGVNDGIRASLTGGIHLRDAQASHSVAPGFEDVADGSGGETPRGRPGKREKKSRKKSRESSDGSKGARSQSPANSRGPAPYESADELDEDPLSRVLERANNISRDAHLDDIIHPEKGSLRAAVPSHQRYAQYLMKYQRERAPASGDLREFTDVE